MARLSEAKPTEPNRRTLGWLLFVARRYVLTRRKDKSNVASMLSIAGLAVGCAVLITVISVMNALQLRSIDGILSFNTFQVRLDDAQLSLQLNDPDLQAELKAACPGLEGITPFFDIQAMMWGYYSVPGAAWIRGIDPGVLLQDRAFMDNVGLVDGNLGIDRPDSIILGRGLARNLDVVVGDQVTVLCFESTGTSSRPARHSLLVTGIIDVGYHEYNSLWAMVSLSTARSLAGNVQGASTGFRLADPQADLQARRLIAQGIARRTGRDQAGIEARLQTWRTFNSAIYGALRVEKLMMLAVVGLIFIVVAVNIFHALRRSVLEKTEDIGVLRSMGAGPLAIQCIFIGEGLIIGTLGGVLGLALGVALSSGIGSIFQAIEGLVNGVLGLLASLGFGVPDGRIGLFYLDQVPSSLVWSEAVGIALFAWASALVASWAASRRVSRIRPAEILRSE